MANNYFRFKQFLIKQDQCAMKVCTDSCILGAYATVAGAGNILDIGTGTGLLALMAAQKSGANIEAIEIDEKAFAQARENIAGSLWADRIQVYHQRLQEFQPEKNKLYDVIICNPPFYVASHKSVQAARNVAMHSQELSLLEISQFCARFLTPAGKLFILLPTGESKAFTNLSQAQGLFPQTLLHIYTAATGKHIRTITSLSRNPVVEVQEQHLYIRNPDNTYTSAFQELLREFYLIF